MADEIIINNVHTPEQHLLIDPPVRPGKGKGRIVSFDPQDQLHKMRGALPPVVPTVNKMFWKTGNVLNQGTTQHCVAYSGEQFLASYPVTNKFYKTPKELYDLCQLNDEWEGAEPLYSGTSVRALMKVLQAAGYIQEYVWAFSADTVRRWLLVMGPVICGTNWYTDMYEPDRSEFIYPTGSPDGGHAYMLRGWDDTIRCKHGHKKGAARIINSWGEHWGNQGKAWICFHDLDGLIKNQGEAVAAIEILNQTPKPVTGVVQ